MSKKYLLKLYVTGQTSKSKRAIHNLHYACQERLGEEYELVVVDVLTHPELAEKDKILATPTLIRLSPPPLRRVIGDMSDIEKVLVGLDLQISLKTKPEQGVQEE